MASPEEISLTKEIENLRERERSAFYVEVRESLNNIRTSLNETNKTVLSVQTWIIAMGSTNDIKATLDDYKIFKAQIKTGLIIMNILWGIAIIIINWFLRK